jgi:hypothetical protein
MLLKQIYSFILTILIGVIILAGIYGLDRYYVDQEDHNNSISKNLEEMCSILGGSYLMEYSECVGITLEKCNSMSGTFNECASPCRHENETEFCIQSCDTVCKLV